MSSDRRTTEGLTASERAARVRFRRALSLTAMTLLLPGSAQLLHGNRKVGRIALRVWLGMIAVTLLGLLVSAVHREFAISLATSANFLGLLRLVLIAAALGWGYLLVDAWRIGDPLSLSLVHRRWIVGVNGAMCLTVMGALLFSSHLASVSRGFIQTSFAGSTVSDSHHGRYNVLLIGGDSGKTRWGLRADSLTVASIDEETGRTVLIGLPRNMAHFPFRKGSVMAEQFPDGFDCDGCYLNGVSTWAQDNTGLFKGSDNPGVDATIMGVEGITGLKINYWAMVNLAGFRRLVDAVGGVKLNVRTRIPVGLPTDSFYTHLKPGYRKLNGFETLWFARARHDSDDYSRMARQKCVMNAMLHQISPSKVLTNFSEIAQASSAMVSTSIPSSEVDRFVSLALKARSQPVSSVSLVPPAIITAHPDIDKVQSMVTSAIDKSEGKKTAKKAAEKAAKKAAEKNGSTATGTTSDGAENPTTVTGGSIGSLKTGYAANQADDLGAAC